MLKALYGVTVRQVITWGDSQAIKWGTTKSLERCCMLHGVIVRL